MGSNGWVPGGWAAHIFLSSKKMSGRICPHDYPCECYDIACVGFPDIDPRSTLRRVLPKEERILLIKMIEWMQYKLPGRYMNWYWKTIRYINDISEQ